MKTILLLAMMVVLISCSRHSDPADQTPDSSPSLRISVLKSGKILADGQETTLAELGRSLTELKRMGGAVRYYREAGREEPHADRLPVELRDAFLAEVVAVDTAAHPIDLSGNTHVRMVRLEVEAHALQPSVPGDGPRTQSPDRNT